MNSLGNPNIKGVDISMWQDPVDFNALKNSGYEVVIMKATEGVDYIDPTFEKHYSAALASGIKIGMYHFMSDATDPTQQAQDFYNSIKGKKFDVIPVLDIEKETKGRTAAQVTDRCLEFLEEFKRLSGYDCIIYTYTNFVNTMLDSRMNKYKLWIAEYGVVSPSNNKIWTEWIGFQYSDSTTVNGLPSKGDVDVFTDKIFISNEDSEPQPKPQPKPQPQPVPLWQQCINGSLVECLQEQLNQQGFANIAVDGYFGEDTLNACPLLSEGNHGEITKIMQERLIQVGYTSILNSGGADGWFGHGTTVAVEHLQANRGLSQDGMVGKETWKQLFLKR